MAYEESYFGEDEAARVEFRKLTEAIALLELTIAASGGGVNVTVSDTPPSNPEIGDIWIDTS